MPINSPKGSDVHKHLSSKSSLRPKHVPPVEDISIAVEQADGIPYAEPVKSGPTRVPLELEPHCEPESLNPARRVAKTYRKLHSVYKESWKRFCAEMGFRQSPLSDAKDGDATHESKNRLAG
jgi:hypothetical protein